MRLSLAAGFILLVGACQSIPDRDPAISPGKPDASSFYQAQAAAWSARRAVRRGRVSQAQLDFLMRGLPLIDGEWTVVAGLSPGKIPKEHRQLMVNLHHAFTEAAGRPVEHVLEEA